MPTEAQKMLKKLDEIEAAADHPIVAGENIAEVLEIQDRNIELIRDVVADMVRDRWNPPE